MKSITINVPIIDLGLKGAANTCRQGTLRGQTPKKITETLGVRDVGCPTRSKTTNEWYFSVGGFHCGIWNYKGSDEIGEFSYFGPREVMIAIFGVESVA